jgi:hypothetical protein
MTALYWARYLFLLWFALVVTYLVCAHLFSGARRR